MKSKVVVLCGIAAAGVLSVSAGIERLAFNSGSVSIPAEWKGKSVRFEQRVAFCELDAKVNGKAAGTAYAPDATVELAPLLNFGAANDIQISERVVADYFGRGDGPFGNKDDARRRRFGRMELVARTAAYIDDFFAQPSWREKKLTVDVEIESLGPCKGEVEVVVADAPGGPAVVKGSAKCDLKAGSNVVTVEIPWANPIPWEPVAHAKTYDCRVTLVADGKPCDSNRPNALFGFREIWREGKEIYLNGHVQRFRNFWFQGLPKDPNDVHKYGFNVSYEGHKHWAYWFEKADEMETRSKAGIAVFTGMPSIYFVHDAIRNNPKCTEQFKRSLKAWMRTWRNYPCIVAASCGVNQICPERNMRPEILGQDPEKGGVVDNIEFACKLAREMNPNCLYYSHADGTEADISTSNLYFNFTPLQEREEWLSQWSTNGTLPWCAVEFGSPYYACWFHSRVPQMTEWLAAYYGEKAYDAESADMLRHSKAFAKSCLQFTHGGWVEPNSPNGKSLYQFNSIAEDYSKMLVYRTNRAWRYYGQNCGMMYLISWPWDTENDIRTRQMQANGDIVMFLGGDPDPTDRTHAYRAGETVRKNLVFIWDGVGENTLSASWKLVDAQGRTVKDGQEKVSLKQGDIRKVPVEFAAPDVKGKTAYRFEVAFNAEKGMDNPANATVKSDSFAFEVYPGKVAGLEAGDAVALFDPEGKTAPILDGLGVKYERIAALAALPDGCSRLVVGWHALSQAQGLEKLAKRIEDGLRVLVMQQEAAVWQALGFTVEDSMARQMFNVSLEGVDNGDLAHWRGAPLAPNALGNVMKHATRRGPRGTHHHAISSAPILIPQRGGFVPLVRGEFDLSYTALLKELRGKGAAWFCAFDFEDRDCPAADRVAAATFRAFLKDDKVSPVKVFADGAHAERIAKTLGLDYEKYDGKEHDDAVLIVGKDSKLSADDVKDAIDDNAHALVIANDAIAGALCGGLEPVTNVFYRGKTGDPLFRFRDGVNYRPLRGGEAVKTVGDILVDQLDPFQAGDRYRTGDGKAAVLARGGWGSRPKGEKDLYLRNASQSEDNFMRRYAKTLAAWGVGAGAKVFSRSLYTKPAEAYEPISQYNVLGPWPSERDDDHYMVDTIFPVDASKGGDSGALAEEMAVKGDVQPNPRFHPLGLKYLDETPQDLRFLDWRPVVKSRADGYVDYATASPLIAAQSFCTCYCVGFLKRRTAGEITIRFGVDWRGKIWVNGKPFEPIYGGYKDEGSKIYEHVKVNAGDNVITVKAGCGQSVKAFWLNVSHEPQEGEIIRDRVPELDDVSLYESANTRFDPYEYVYW